VAIKVVSIQVNLLQSLKEELEKKDRQSDLYEQLKATEEKMKKAETEADQFCVHDGCAEMA
jgi:ATP-dependent Lon protease